MRFYRTSLSHNMEKQQVPKVELNSGHKMPLIGMGTAAMPLPNEELCSIFIDAIEIGYRHFDTASLYGSEEALGQAVAEAIRRGLIKSREEMFIISKLWCTDAHHDLVLPAIKGTLKRLGLEYLDLYLVHWPVRLKHGVKHGVEGLKFTAEDMLPFDMRKTWEAMEECSRLGLSRSIGVSNFSSKKLSQLLEHATIPPAVNQKKLRDYCKEKGIHVSAWSPLAANGAFWGSLGVMESPLLKEIAATRCKLVSQIALRWIYEQGSSVIVKSFNKERMKANIEIFGWELSEEDFRKIDQVPQRRGYLGDIFIHENGPYKSLQELWDDDDC